MKNYWYVVSVIFYAASRLFSADHNAQENWTYDDVFEFEFPANGGDVQVNNTVTIGTNEEVKPQLPHYVSPAPVVIESSIPSAKIIPLENHQMSTTSNYCFVNTTFDYGDNGMSSTKRYRQANLPNLPHLQHFTYKKPKRKTPHAADIEEDQPEGENQPSSHAQASTVKLRTNSLQKESVSMPMLPCTPYCAYPVQAPSTPSASYPPQSPTMRLSSSTFSLPHKLNSLAHPSCESACNSNCCLGQNPAQLITYQDSLPPPSQVPLKDMRPKQEHKKLNWKCSWDNCDNKLCRGDGCKGEIGCKGAYADKNGFTRHIFHKHLRPQGFYCKWVSPKERKSPQACGEGEFASQEDFWAHFFSEHLSDLDPR